MTILALLSIIGWVYLAFFRGQFWRPLLTPLVVMPSTWPSVDIIVPARDEAELLPGTLPSLLTQDYPGAWRIILVDDHSSDGTGDVAERLAKTKGQSEKLAVIKAPDLPSGWSGKLSALNAGVTQSSSDYILFTDADIFHPSNSLRELMAHTVENKIDLSSLMVKLHCQNFAEKLLIPAFVFFFAMLYPFRQVNDNTSRIGAAAGGVILIKRKVLDGIGGLAHIKSAIIDDCALAQAVKDNRGRVELTMSRDVKSLRMYPGIQDIWRMITRTAFDQLDYNPAILVGTIMGMFILFVIPALIPVIGGTSATRAGLVAWLMMAGIYAPMIRFYGLPVIWAVMLPAAAVVYMGATIDSARLYWQGKGGLWKGRHGVGSQDLRTKNK